MNPTIDRLKLIFLGIFVLGCAGVWAYQIFWAMPAKRCEANGQWWDGSTRTCAQPMLITSITGRPAGMSRREWAEKQAAQATQREREGYPAAATAPAPAAPAVKPAPAAPAAPEKK
jgi:hypothetical protein